MRLRIALAVCCFACALPLHAEPISAVAVTGSERSSSVALVPVAAEAGVNSLTDLLFAEYDQPFTLLTPDYLRELVCGDSAAVSNSLAGLSRPKGSDGVDPVALSDHSLQIAQR